MSSTITSYIKNAEAKGEDISSLKVIMMNYIKKNYKELDKSINDYQRQKQFSESEFRKFYIMVNSIYENLYNNNKFSIFSYNIENVKEAEEHFRNPQLVDDNKAVTITTTTCKRTDLITRTIDSFLECVLDYKKYVKEWIIIDDNSDEKDRAFMKEKYPFIRFIYKDQSNKGHPKSMNMFLEEVKTPYIFNLEDDFEFFRRDNFFERMHSVLELDKSYGQCLMNINYTEDTDSGNAIWGSTMSKTNKNIRYFIHNYYTGKKLEEEQRKLNGPSCLYWPHFSFRVGLTKTSVLKEIGKYDETAKHFEMEYAYRYVNKGYKTTFLDGIYCAHIGRRTYERNTDKKNAYDLNKEVQFGETHRIEEQPKSIKEISTFVINLKRRPDRLRNFFTKNKDELYPITVFEGVDGKTLLPSHKVQKAFSTGDYNYRRGIVGCAMSHIKIWKEFVTKLSTNYCIVFEDDAELCKDFHHKVLYLLDKHKDFDIMFLHYNPYPQYNLPDLYSDSPPKADFWSIERSMRENMGSGAGYILSRNGAINLLKHIEEKGVYNAIDWVMFKSSNKIMYVNPMLVRANCFQSTNGRCDTDIQNVFNSVCFKDDLEWDRYEISYLANKLISSYHNKEKSSICNLFYKGFDENVLKQLTFDLKNISTVKNIKGICMMISNEIQPISYLTDYVCILPVNLLQKLDEEISLYPIKRYTTNKYIYCIPDKYADLILDDKVWEDKKLLNTVCPF
jgi:GR25 family glycosyltransferase involved in LPS biosynthesis